MKTLLALVFTCAPMFAQDAARPGRTSAVYFPLAALASGSTTAFAKATDVYTVSATNSNASTSVTVTVSCTGGVSFVNAQLDGITTKGNNLAITFTDGMACANGVTVTTTGTGVNMQITGRQ